MEVKIELQLDDKFFDTHQNLPEGMEIVSFETNREFVDLAVVGCLVVRFVKYSGGIVSVLTGAKKIYEYFKGRNVKSATINGQPVDLNNEKDIERALESNEV